MTFRKVWGLIAEPRNITLIYCAVYVWFIAQGVVNFTAPHVDVEDSIPRTVVNCLLVGGGLVGLAATPRGLWLIERPGIFMIICAYAIHLYWTVGDFNHDGDIEPQKCARLIVIMLLLSARFLSIKRAMLDPAKP